MLVTDLTLATDIHIISRQSLGEVLREQWIQHRGMTDPDSTIKLGQVSGARYLLKGSVYHLNVQLSVEMHLLDVERGVVVRASRVTGTVDDVPALERDLSQEVGEFFGSQAASNVNISIEPDIEPVRTPSFNAVVREDVDAVHASDLGYNPQSPVLASDVPLRLDRTRRLREEAWLFADEVWRRGFVIELGVPHDFWNLLRDDAKKQDDKSLWLPVSSSFSPDRLRDIHRNLKFSRVSDMNEEPAKGKLVWEAEGNAPRLFAERFRAPRRIFVRAISQSGEVLAVTSPWSWRVDQAIEVDDSGVIRVLLLPEPMIVGNAEFSTKMLSRHRRIDHFDALVVSVPEERRLVSVEVFKPGNVKSQEGHIFEQQRVAAERNLKHWFLGNWSPPVTESRPVQGYLPGNRRSIHLRIRVEKGIVEDIQLTRELHEDVLQADMERLMSQLLGDCVYDCHGESGEGVEAMDVFAARVQLDLLKDLHHVGLGEVVP